MKVNTYQYFSIGSGYNNCVDFKQWIWNKFDEWRRGTTRGVTEYASYLGVNQPTVSAWLKGSYGPRGDSLRKLAKVYPDVYEVFGESPPLPSSGLPLEFVGEVRVLLEEIKLEIERAGIAPESPEAVKISNAILDRWLSKRRSIS
jgi:transcriptional regulator with XRE-family HTH domain